MKEKNFWNKFIVTCNPWFLSSAVILLFGIYQIRVDEVFLGSEEMEVLYSFFTLQVYEIMALLSAWFFLKRLLNYDAVFLIIVVGILSLVPFLNLSQALHLENSYGASIAATTSFLALIKFLFIKRAMPKVNLPWLMLIPYMIVLAVNAWIPNHFKALNVEGNRGAKDLMLMIIYYVLPTLGLFFFVIYRKLVDLQPVYKRKWIAIILTQIWFIVTVLNLVSMQYVYSIALEKETVIVGTMVLAYLWGFEYIRAYFRHGALVLVNILVLALSTDHTVFVLASLFHIGLAFVWSTNKMARMLQLSVLIFSCILNQDYGVGEQLPAAIFIILTFALLIHKSFICYIIYAVYCFLFFASIPLRLPHMEITFIFGMLLSFATFLINDKEFKSLRFLIFAGMSSWALYGVMEQSSLYYQLQFSAGFAFLVILLLRRLMGNCAPAYFFVVPLLHVSSTPLSHVLLHLKKLPMSAYIITVSFIIFGIGFYLNIKKSKTLIGAAEQQME